MIVPAWPCFITPTGGSEVDQAGSTFADRTYQVEGHTDPGNPIREKDYLLLNGRKLNVASVDDPQMNGEYSVLTCGEDARG